MLRFDDLDGRRSEAALELLAEGERISFRGVHLAFLESGEIGCTVYTRTVPAAVTNQDAWRAFKKGMAIVEELTQASAGFRDLLTGRSLNWELHSDYGSGAAFVAALDGTGQVVRESSRREGPPGRLAPRRV